MYAHLGPMAVWPSGRMVLGSYGPVAHMAHMDLYIPHASLCPGLNLLYPLTPIPIKGLLHLVTQTDPFQAFEVEDNSKPAAQKAASAGACSFRCLVTAIVASGVVDSNGAVL